MLPDYLRPEHEQFKITHKMKEASTLDKRSPTKSPVIKTTIHNGVKNYQWIKDEFHPHLHQYFNFGDTQSAMSTYLAMPERLLLSKDNTIFGKTKQGKPMWFKPPLDELHPVNLGSTSNFGTSFLSDF